MYIRQPPQTPKPQIKIGSKIPNLTGSSFSGENPDFKRTLDFLAWVDRNIFVKTFGNELINIGIDKDVALLLETEMRMLNKNIMELYQGFIDYKPAKAAIIKYLDDMYKKWMSYLLRLRTNQKTGV
jgi:hypothetical protein